MTLNPITWWRRWRARRRLGQAHPQDIIAMLIAITVGAYIYNELLTAFPIPKRKPWIVGFRQSLAKFIKPWGFPR